ncbi:Uncharacterised protein [Enterobacter cloacae]|nr:Uncharacterised protein [Enterobacter cloacae]
MAFTATVELLRTGKGYSDQIAIMPVGIKGMSFEMRLNCLNTCFCMLTQLKPVVCHTALLLPSALSHLA